MSKSFFLSIVFVLSLLVSVFVVPSEAFAQAYNETQMQQDNTTGTTGTTDNGGGLADWWWVLPLVAVPLLFFAFSRGTEDDDTYQENRRQYPMGAKGGRSKRATDDTEDEVL